MIDPILSRASLVHHVRMLGLRAIWQRRLMGMAIPTAGTIRWRRQERQADVIATQLRSVSLSKTGITAAATLNVDTVDDDDWEVLFERHKKTAQSLLEKRPGTFSSAHFAQAKKTLDLFKRTSAKYLQEKHNPKTKIQRKNHMVEHSATTAAIMANLSISLIEKLVSEMAISGNKHDASYVCDPNYHNPFFNFWKETAKSHGDKVVSPRELANKLKIMVQQLPEFRTNIITYGIIMDVIIKKAHPRKAPMVAHELLNFIRAEAKETRNKDLKPTTANYNQVLRAWSMSRLQKAPEMMESLIQQMKDEGLKPDHYSFNTVLHFWSEKGNVRKVEEALAAMQRDGSPPTRTNIAQVLFCYCKVLDLEKANSFLQVFLRMNSQGHAEEQLTWDCGQRILLAYREAVETRDIPHVRKRNMAEQAHVCFEQIMNHCEINCIKAKESKSKLIGTMMDLFCSAGSYDKVEMLVQDRVLNPVLLNILLKALTKDKQVERATSILTNALTGDETSLLNDANGSLSNHSFHTVMNGWADSSDPDAFGKTFAVYRLMTEDPRSIALGLQPNFITFNILLKSLAKSNRPDVGKRAIEILDELDRRYRSGDANCRPTENTFNSAILACLHGGNCELAETVMDRMNKMGLSPSLKTYNDIMSHWAKIGTRASAERTEQILAKMKQIAKSRPDLAPDAVSYNIVLSAWARASCPLSAKKMWMLYEEMLNAKIEPDMAAMNTLICFFSKSKVRAIIQKADDLLVIMEKSSKRTLSPDFRHFVPVIQGWLSIGDVDSAAATLVRRVEAFMSETGTKDASPNAAPNSIIIDQIVHGYLRQGHLEKAMSFLEKFKQLKDESSLPEGPCVRSFTSLLSNWEKSSHPNKAFAITKLRGIIANWNASSLNA